MPIRGVSETSVGIVSLYHCCGLLEYPTHSYRTHYQAAVACIGLLVVK